MEEESGIDWKKPVTDKQFLVFLLFCFFIGGLTLGYLFGGYQVHKEWQSYFESSPYKCICDNESISWNIYTGGVKW